jgi:HNH endonuclease
MWVMPPQDVGDLDEALDRALIYANGTPIYALTDAERAAIHVVYQLYDNMLGQPDASLTPAVLAAARPYLRDGYNQIQIGARLEALRSRLLASSDACPYCGFGEIKELDHYLPRSTFGELALYPNNLIPSCGPCNNAKRTVVPGMAPAEGPGLIHAYFQVLPEVDFLKADIVFAAGRLDVAFHIEAGGLDPVLAAKLQFQLDRLKLNDRYPKQINKFMSEQRTGILMLEELGAPFVSVFLKRSANSMARTFHRNDWRVALFRALGADADFCEDPKSYLGGDNVE